MSDLIRVSPEEADSTCAWCEQSIPDDTPVFSFGGKTRAGADLSKYEGEAVRMDLVTKDRSVIAIVPAPGTDARRDGYDFMFLTCSEACASKLKSVMDAETALGHALLDDIERLENN